MIRKILNLFLKKEQGMAKKNATVVKYFLSGDGVKPAFTPWGATVRLPVQLSIPRGQTRVLDLGIRFDAAALVSPATYLSTLAMERKVSYHIGGASANAFLKPGTDSIKLAISAIGDDDVDFDEKAAILDLVFVTGPDELSQG